MGLFLGAPRRAVPCADVRTPQIQTNAQKGRTACRSGRSRGPPSACGDMRDSTSFFGSSAKHADLARVLFAVTPVLQKGADFARLLTTRALCAQPPSRGTVRRSFLRDHTLFPRPSTGYTSANVCQEAFTSCRRGSRLRAFLRLCFREGETLLFLHKICLSRRTVREAVPHLAARRVVHARPREEQDENEDIVYRPGMENWPRLSHLSVHNKIKQLEKRKRWSFDFF